MSNARCIIYQNEGIIFLRRFSECSSSNFLTTSRDWRYEKIFLCQKSFLVKKVVVNFGDFLRWGLDQKGIRGCFRDGKGCTLKLDTKTTCQWNLIKFICRML